MSLVDEDGLHAAHKAMLYKLVHTPDQAMATLRIGLEAYEQAKAKKKEEKE